MRSVLAGGTWALVSRSLGLGAGLGLLVGSWVLALTLLAPLPVLAQKPAAETVKSLNPPEGFEIKLFASEPMVVNPIAMDVDTYGRVWVTEGVNYRRNVANPPDNKVKVLEDTDGDGVADKVTVFTSDLNAALGICVAGGRIYVPESPNLYVYEDLNNDLVPDGPRKTLLTGFGGKNHDHGVHSQVFGPDHKLYMTQGDTSYNVTGPDGKNIQFKWGAMIRCEADGSKLEDFAVNFRNPFELAVDSFGNVWCSDNDNDGLKSVRICWILEGGNYGWFGGPENIRNPDGSFDPIHHWRADKPGFVPYTLITGFGSPCGMTFYEGNAFGPKFQGNVIHCDAGPREVRLYTPQRLKGVGYTAQLENIVTGTDNYFRPVDPCVAPDGSLYLTDWYDGGVGGHAYNDPTRGRIYRMTPTGKKLARKEKPGPYKNDDDALVALASPNHATTFLARERLLASGQGAVPALTRLAQGDDLILKARALWLLDRIGGSARDVVRAELKSKDPKFRALAVRILRRHGEAAESDLLTLADDADGEVFKEVLLGLRQLKSAAATAALIKAFDRYDGSDRYLLETLYIAAKGREAEVFSAVVDKPGTTVSPRIINLVRILKPEDATKFLTSKLASANISAESTAALLTALSATPTPQAGQSVAGLLSGNSSPEVKKLALDALRKNLKGTWSGLKADPELKKSLLAALASEQLAADALAVIGESNLTDYGPAVVNLIGKEKRTPVSLQLAAIDVATRFNLESAGPGLASLLTSDNASLKGAGLKALVSIRDTKTLGGVLADAKASPELKQQVVDGLVSTNDGALYLLRSIDNKKLDKGLTERTIAAAIEHPDVNVRLLFEKFIPEKDRPKTLGQSFKADDILALKGDVSRGEGVFLRSGAAACNKCHRVKGKGTDIGPDLSQIGRKYERKTLLQTIMDPSAGIAPEYVPYVVETVSGKVYAGFLHEQNDQGVTLKTIEGTFVRFEKSQIEALVKQTKSLMPELVLKNVTAQDAADLLAYLESLQVSETQPSHFKVLGPFPNGAAKDRTTDFGPEKNPAAIDPAAKYAGLGGKEVTWSTVEAISGGGAAQIDVVKMAQRLKVPTEKVIFYFAVNIESTTAQPATLYVGSDDGVQVWLNGKKVHDFGQSRAIKIGEDKLSVELKPGKNLLLFKLDQGMGPAGLSLSAEARQPLTFSLP